MHSEVARTLTSLGGLRPTRAISPAGKGCWNVRSKYAAKCCPRAILRSRTLSTALVWSASALEIRQERRSIHESALAIREKALGFAHPDVRSPNNFGNVHNEIGDYATSRSLHERSLTIREKALGPDHPDVAMSLNNLAISVRIWATTPLHGGCSSE